MGPRPLPGPAYRQAGLPRTPPLLSPSRSPVRHYARRLTARPALCAPSALLGRLFQAPSPPPTSAEPGLEAWLRDRCGQALVLNCTVAADGDSGGGRGLVATTRLGAGAVAAALPPSALLSADAAVATSRAGAAAAAGRDGSPVAALIAALAEARGGRGAAPAPAWSAYAASLPRTTGCVLEWSDAQVGWLTGSPLAGLAAAARAEAAAACGAAAVPALVDAAGMDEASAAGAAAWAAAMLLTRLIRTGSAALDAGAGGVLAPVLDMANHAPGGGGSGLPGPAAVEWSGAALAVRVTAATAAGAAVHASYGPDRPAGELLLAYGFLPPPGPATPGGGLPVRPAADDPRSAEKLAALAARGAPPPEALTPLRPGRLPAGLVERAAFCAAPPGGADLEALAASLLDGVGGPPPPALLALGARAAADAASRLLAAKRAAPGPPADDPLGAVVADALARERRALEGVAADLAAAARAWERVGRSS